jgi:uncharacterized membrane protein
MPPENNPGQPSASHSNNTGMAILAYLGILIIIPFLTNAHNDPFVKFHLKQGLALIISFVVGFVISIIPILGWILSPLIMIFNVVLLIIGIINAASGKEKALPFIGSIGNKFNF